jgi:hypothetical protein
MHRLPHHVRRPHFGKLARPLAGSGRPAGSQIWSGEYHGGMLPAARARQVQSWWVMRARRVWCSACRPSRRSR